ncbi:hypothetical protein AX16_000196 [Volvariella volvacea WC 439]|nr:hypothetical protein AX16_000196 [Volvariella volvacea WC 439]
MSSTMPSNRFLEIYHSLPIEAQGAFIEDHLAPLLNTLPGDASAQILSSVSAYKMQLGKLPVLDIKGKRKEIDYLLDELNRDHKNAFTKERSNLEELLESTIQSLVSWLNDIWMMAYEYRVNFMQAHTCLLFTAEVLRQLTDHPAVGSCRCTLLHVPIDFTIRNRQREVVKSFSLTGTQALEDSLLWIWRDVLVSLYAKGSKNDEAKVAQMLDDIETSTSWRRVLALLVGGKRRESTDPEDDWASDDDDSVEYYGDLIEDENEDECHVHPEHWPESMEEHRIKLQNAVRNHLLSVFESAPSHSLYNSIVTISPDQHATRLRLRKMLDEFAGNDPNSLVAALDVYTSESNATAISKLLRSYSYLLRPRDHPSLRAAVMLISRNTDMQAYAFQILEKELMDTITHIRAILHSTFRHIDKSKHQKDLEEILELRVGSPTRRERIERWVEAVLSPNVDPMNPMAFAAMMFGFPPAPGVESDESDLMGLVDIDENDPDVANLRDEFKPNLKNRLLRWTADGASMRGGIAILAKVYIQAAEIMPYLKASDVVDEMLNRLSERPTKHYLSEALDALSAFCKLQRKQLGAKGKTKKRRTQRTSTTGIENLTPDSPFTSTSVSNSSSPIAASASISSNSSQDQGATVPGPPPLSPLAPPPAPGVHVTTLPYPLFGPSFGLSASLAQPPQPPAPSSSAASHASETNTSSNPAPPPSSSPPTHRNQLRPRPADIEDVD